MCGPQHSFGFRGEGRQEGTRLEQEKDGAVRKTRLRCVWARRPGGQGQDRWKKCQGGRE